MRAERGTDAVAAARPERGSIKERGEGQNWFSRMGVLKSLSGNGRPDGDNEG